MKTFRLDPLLQVSPARLREGSGLEAANLPFVMAFELPFSPTAASVRSSGFVLEDSLRGYAGGVSLDLLASLLLGWATIGLRGLPLRLSLAFALFGCLHLFGGWQREPQELAFSVTVLLCVLGFGAHARSLAARRARHETLLRSACWAEYWQGQLVCFLRQVAFAAVAVLAILALWTMEGRLVLKALGNPSRSESQPANRHERRSPRSEPRCAPAVATRPARRFR